MARPLRIGVNALFLIPGGVGGTEIYLRNLLQAIAAAPREHHYTVFINNETGVDLAPDHAQFQVVRCAVNAVSRPRRILYEQLAFLGKLRQARLDVLFNPGFTAPILSSVPNVTLIHDLQHKRHPEHFKPADLLAWRVLVRAAAMRSAHILTVSDASKADIAGHYRLKPQSVTVASPGVEPELFRLTRQNVEPLILCVSTLHPHKNIERLIDAFTIFHQSHPQYQLILAGMRGFHAEAIERKIQSLPCRQQITVTGWIPRTEILDYYNRASIAVFPSTFEGFGIPVAEALAAGVPLIISDMRPMTDIAGDAALLFPPDDTAALAKAMDQLASDDSLQRQLTERGKRRAAAYTWSATASVTLEVLEQAAVRA